MIRLAFSRTALYDLKRLRAFIAEKNPNAAIQIATQLKQRIERLRDFPLMGKPVEDFKDMRELVAGDYVVRYQVSVDCVYIVKIWHVLENRDKLWW